MKFSASALFLSMASAATAAANTNEDRSLASLADKWNIQDPAVTQNGLAMDFAYQLSNFIVEGQAYYEVYTSGCKESGTEVATGAGLTMSPLVDIDPAATSVVDDDGFVIDDRSATVPVAIDVATIAGASDIYTETGSGDDLGATIEFCIRFGLNTLTDPASEVNFLESIVTMTVDLGDGFTVDAIQVTPKDQLLNTANQAYTVTGFLCNPDDGSELTQGVDGTAAAFNQGSLISVCVKPDAQGVSDGIVMRTIDDFAWSRDTTNQEAIASGAASTNSLTSFDPTACAGGAYCTFSTILFAAFYSSNGSVSGTGTSTMQFGRRRLQEQDGRQVRSLQQEPEAAATSPVSLDVDVQAADDAPSLETAAGASVGTMFAAIVASVGAVALL